MSRQPHIRPFTSVLLFALLGLPLAAAPLSTPARAGSAQEGQSIASRWCVSCHDIGKSGRPTASDTAPTFYSIAHRKKFNRVHLEAWLGHPHPPMPNLNLTRNEIDSLIDYIESLRTPN